MLHRHKHRFLRTTYLLAVIVLFFLLMSFLMKRSEELLSLIASFIVGLVLLVGYEAIVVGRLKDKELMLNSLTQVYIGTIAISGALVLLVSYTYFRLPFETCLLLLPVAVIIILLMTVKGFDTYLSKRLR
jgi:hypothetical protein